ncbi:hypothetical protein [Mycoplana ramosa]|uniref:Scaffolding protein n=1 Tax=Mycoplana ramosa TaxID=40837 RepID=A0ABW3YR34_MYCRA
MEDLGNNPEMGTATELDINEAANLISQLDVPEDSVEQSEEHVEAPETDVDEQSADVDETPEQQFFEINGEQVSLDDLRNGYLRQQDYTRKTQEIAEQRRVYQENQRDVNQLRSEALQGLEALKMQVAAEFRAMEQPDFDFLAENDPAEFIRQRQLWEKRENAVRQMYEAEMHIRQKQAEYEAEQHRIALQESQARFVEKYPEMKDAAKANAVFEDITQILLDANFTKEEIQGVSDFRIIDILYRLNSALKAQKVVPEAIKKVEEKPRISVKGNSTKTRDYAQAGFDKLNKSGNVNDAAALIKALKF